MAVAAFVALAGTSFAPSAAHAQDRAMGAGRATVAVIGIVSEEGDDDFATDLTSAVRTAASQIESWALDTREVTLSQMLLAHGCMEADSACLGKIAKNLGVNQLIYGTISRGADDANFAVSFGLYNTATSAIDRTVNDSVPMKDSDRDQLNERAVRYVSELSGLRIEGVLRVHANIPGAEVIIDGGTAGTVDSTGNFQAQLATGNHDLEVKSPGHESYRSSVSVVPHHGATVEVFLTPAGRGPDLGTPSADGGGNDLAWLGWSLVGLGVAGFATTAVSWVMISGADSDQPFVAYRKAVPKGKDACTEASAGEEYGFDASDLKGVKSTCDKASLFEVLAWVGLGVGVAAVGTGLFILLTGDDDDDKATAASPFSIKPSVNADGGSLTATYRF